MIENVVKEAIGKAMAKPEDRQETLIGKQSPDYRMAIERGQPGEKQNLFLLI